MMLMTLNKKNSTTDTIGPKTWIPRSTDQMISGLGVAGAAILALVGSVVGYLPIMNGQFPLVAALVLSIACVPTSIYLWYLAVRRMLWEHRNGGVWRKSIDGGGIILLIFAIFIVAVGAVITVSSVMHDRQRNTANQASEGQSVQSTDVDAAANKEAAKTPEATQSSENSSVASDAPSASTPAKSSSSQATTTPHSPAPSQPAPSSTPLTISRVTLNGAQYLCSGGGVVVQISSATVQAAYSDGGPFTWQTEVVGAMEPRTPYATTQTIAPHQTYLTLGSATSPGFFYSSTYARDGESVRVHVTAPNDIASPWFTVPQGTMDSCRG